MIRPKITKLTEFRFEVAYPDHEPLRLDFEPLHLAAMKLHPCQSYVLKHWQARPRGLRRFGLFAWREGEGWYSCHDTPEASTAIHYDLQIGESNRIPSAALFYPNASVLDNKIRYQAVLPRFGLRA